MPAEQLATDPPVLVVWHHCIYIAVLAKIFYEEHVLHVIYAECLSMRHLILHSTEKVSMYVLCIILQ